MKTGHNKFEKDARLKLTSREIQPSSQAWDRLDAMLAVGELEKKKQKFNWIYLAACMVGFILIATMFFKQGQTKQHPENKVAVEETVSHPQTNQQPNIPEANDIQVAENAAEHQKQPAASKPLTPKCDNLVANKQPQQNFLDESAATNQTTEFQSSITNQQLIAEAVPSDNQTRKRQKITVDPKALLSQVDGELDQSFRVKVINKVGKSFNDVKVALSNRNQQ